MQMYPETVESAWGSIGKPPRGPATNQQLVAIGLDRFKKDDVKMYPPPPPSKWGSPGPWGRQPDTVWDKKPSGFVPSSGPFNSVGHEFRNGLYIGDQSFEHDFFGPRSSLF